MGTIIYENRNSIVELENAEERTQEHIGILTGVALILSSLIFLIIKTGLFMNMSIMNQLMIVGGLVFFIMTIIWSMKLDKTENDLKMFTLVGLALMIPSLIF